MLSRHKAVPASRKYPNREKHMSQSKRLHPASDVPAFYQIRLGGRLSPDWSDWLAGMEMTVLDDGEDPVTILSGWLPDQAALAGVLSCVCNFGLMLISVERREKKDAT
jgi:hypothetical protein